MWTLKGKGNCYKCNTQGKNKHFANTGNNAYSESLSQKRYMHHSNSSNTVTTYVLFLKAWLQANKASGLFTYDPAIEVVRQHSFTHGHQQPEGIFLFSIQQQHRCQDVHRLVREKAKFTHAS